MALVRDDRDVFLITMMARTGLMLWALARDLRSLGPRDAGLAAGAFFIGFAFMALLLGTAGGVFRPFGWLDHVPWLDAATIFAVFWIGLLAGLVVLALRVSRRGEREAEAAADVGLAAILAPVAVMLVLAPFIAMGLMIYGMLNGAVSVLAALLLVGGAGLVIGGFIWKSAQ